MLSFPITLSALHVYRALSSSSVLLITNELSSCTAYLPPIRSFSPFFVQVTVGFGTPVVGHWMVILVLVSAVTLSPMVNVMGLRSRASIVLGLPGIMTFGLVGSLKQTDQS